tara:strand:+ start:8683 stop:8826 length:144 start_codon:yes stop_codon:yes gene_type:complete
MESRRSPNGDDWKAVARSGVSLQGSVNVVPDLPQHPMYLIDLILFEV